jgi:hypothetical protein
MGDQSLLSNLIQPWFQHIDDEKSGTFGFQFSEEGNQCFRRGSAVINKQSQGPVDSRLKSTVRF